MVRPIEAYELHRCLDCGREAMILVGSDLDRRKECPYCSAVGRTVKEVRRGA
jgi:DNA-directed RNA polymerase subunit RPC12/RpoP